MIMDTPICDFVRRYAKSNALRLHMPGHKGADFLGFERLDITEIDGADSLYEASGIIHKSEKNAGELFGCPTYYSTEGSSLCIRAMMYLITLYAKQNGQKPLIAAARNAHKTFLSAAAMLDFDIMWLYSKESQNYLSCVPDAKELDAILSDARQIPTAVYITSPDYLGNTADIASIAEVCRRHGCLLAVDNAHGAYLKFLKESAHPIDLGADICCDSAHKTLPVLTGGAYLHISPSAPEMFTRQAKNALALFGSTSPSYLILQSLDKANKYLTDYAERLQSILPSVKKLKDNLSAYGYRLLGNEPLKITVSAKEYGYSGKELARILSQKDIICEFSDPDFIVFMLTPENTADALQRLQKALSELPQRVPIQDAPPIINEGEKVLSVREATLSQSETVSVDESCGRVLAAATVGCPPAVPILVGGERIDSNAIACFKYYGINSLDVVYNT